MIKNCIKKISSRYFFFWVLVLFSLSKLLPILSAKNILTYLVFLFSIIVFIFRMINIIFIKKRLSINLLKIITLLLFCFSVLSYLIDAKFTKDGLFNGREYITLATIFINFVIAFSFDEDDKDINKAIFINKISLIVLFFSFLYIFPNTIYSIITKNPRIYGFSVNVTTYSHFVIIAFACSLYLLLCNGNKYIKFLSFVNTFFQVMMLIFTQQRNAYVGFLIGVVFSFVLIFVCNKLYFLLYNIKNNLKIIIIFGIVFIVVFSIILKFIPLNVILYKIRLMNTTGRFESWQLETAIFTENNMLFGYGGSMSIKANQYFINHPEILVKQTYKDFLNVGWTHSIYLAFLYDFGIIGLIWLLVIIISILICYFKYINKYKFVDQCFGIIIFMTFCLIPPLFIGIFDENMLINIYNLPNIMFIIIASFLGDSLFIKKINFKNRIKYD